MQIIECVPNFSEGRDLSVIKQITDAISAVEGVQLLDVDPGAATNRTVVTFVGEPQAVINGAYAGMKKAAEVIDMSWHQGEHPRMGATDVCPLIPIANISMDEVAEWAHKLGKMAGADLGIPFFMYEYAATNEARKNLAVIRAGEYEGMAEKLKQAEWQPDYGPASFNAKTGTTAIGARDFLIAYNVNLNTTSVRRANSVAFDVREKGRVKREGNPITGPIVTDANGEPLREPGACKSVKGIGWFIEEYGVAQISMNLTNIQDTSFHTAFDACCASAEKRGLRVTGSELVGLVPLQVMLDAGKHFLQKQRRSIGVSEKELIEIAIKTMGLNELTEFDPQQKIIEYRMRKPGAAPLLDMNLQAFADETASESPAPGGGSISAYVGALGASLATMVANLSSHKRDWDDRWEEFSEWAAKGQACKDRLLKLVDEDTNAFNEIMAAFKLPKGSAEEKKSRSAAIQAGTKNAIEIPLQVMRCGIESFEVILAMADIGNPNSVSDAGVGALCMRAAVHGAFLNIKINSSSLKDKDYVTQVLAEGEKMIAIANEHEKAIVKLVEDKI